MSEDKGIAINRCHWLGSQIVQLRERIPALEKLTRKTPPKTLLAEWEKVKAASAQLQSCKEQLATFEPEWLALRLKLYASCT